MKRHCNRDCPIKLICATCSASFQSQYKLNLHVKQHGTGLLDMIDHPLPADVDPLPLIPQELELEEAATSAPPPRSNLDDLLHAKVGPAGDCAFETATGVVIDEELPTFDFQLKLPEVDLNESFNWDDI